MTAQTIPPLQIAAPQKHYDGYQAQILSLLGSGLSPSVVATAVGVDPSYVSQLLAEESFAFQVTELRCEALKKHSDRDASYDALEDALIAKMQDCLPLMYKPGEVLAAIRVINGAKRRGEVAAAPVDNQRPVIQLVLPTKIVQQFTLNANNQIVQIGDQTMVTMPSAQLANSHEELRMLAASRGTTDDLLTQNTTLPAPISST